MFDFQTLRFERFKTGIENQDDEPDFTVLTVKRRICNVQEDGNVFLRAPRGTGFANLLKRRKTMKLVLFGGENRVPFTALYQVNASHTFTVK